MFCECILAPFERRSREGVGATKAVVFLVVGPGRDVEESAVGITAAALQIPHP